MKNMMLFSMLLYFIIMPIQTIEAYSKNVPATELKQPKTVQIYERQVKSEYTEKKEKLPPSPEVEKINNKCSDIVIRHSK